MKTRAKILSISRTAFNKKGYAAVTLQDLSQHLNMSRGNLTYHFKTKDLILEAIADEMWAKMEQERSKSRSLPSFENLHNEVQLYYQIQKEYSFIFLDIHVLNHPIIKNKFRTITEQTMKDNKAAIAFAIQIGSLKPESHKGLYHNIAFTTWMLTFFWLSQQIIRGEKTQEDGEKLIWSLLIPHMTEKGITSFKKFFGEDYFNQLGEPFEADIQSFITF